jgi:lipoyl synthase
LRRAFARPLAFRLHKPSASARSGSYYSSLSKALRETGGLFNSWTFLDSRLRSDYNSPKMAIFKELPILDDFPGARLASEQARPLSPSRAKEILALRKPEWLKIRPPAGESYTQIKGLLRERKLHTVCEEAHCPNVAECWASGTATFMLGGDTCTRACRFCAVKTSRTPPPLDPEEPYKIAESVAALGLHYVVLTSVDRDDLKDGGAGHFAATIRELKRLNPKLIVEALVPDFRGDVEAIQILVDSRLDVYAHNIETVKRLQYRVRDPRANYLQSLATLRTAKTYAKTIGHELFTKSAVMLGLGEEARELDEAYADLREYDVDVLTLGQYLRPSMQHLPVEKYYTPGEFDELGKQAEARGFLYVASGPMVRSSYRAGEFFIQGVIEKRRKQNAIEAARVG